MKEDFSGAWKMHIHGTMGIFKITDSKRKIGGVYEFQQPFMGQSNGTLEGWYDAELSQTNLNLGEGRRIFIDGVLKFHPDFVEVLETAFLQTQVEGIPGSWHDGSEFPFGASANLSSHR